MPSNNDPSRSFYDSTVPQDLKEKLSSPASQAPAAGSEAPKLKDDPLGIEFARRVAGAHTKLTQDLISSAAPVKPKRWSDLVSLVTAAGDSETNVTLEAPVASLASAPTIIERIIERANDYREMARVSRNADNWSAAENEDGVASGLFKAARMIREANHE
jgi:hypothetical protein